MGGDRHRVSFRYQWISWLYVTRLGALVALVVLLGLAVWRRDAFWLICAGASGGLLVLAAVVHQIEGSTVRCPGCCGTLLQAMRCMKHERARRVFGSYTLHAALVLATFSETVLCPYCGATIRVGGGRGAGSRSSGTEARALRGRARRGGRRAGEIVRRRT